MNFETHLLSFPDISIFHQKLANFAISKNADIDCTLILNFNFFEFLKVALKNMATILIMSAKIVTSGLLKRATKSGWEIIFVSVTKIVYTIFQTKFTIWYIKLNICM